MCAGSSGVESGTGQKTGIVSRVRKSPAGRISVIESFIPGFWEDMVGNPRGDVPPEKLDLRFEPEEALR